MQSSQLFLQLLDHLPLPEPGGGGWPAGTESCGGGGHWETVLLSPRASLWLPWWKHSYMTFSVLGTYTHPLFVFSCSFTRPPRVIFEKHNFDNIEIILTILQLSPFLGGHSPNSCTGWRKVWAAFPCSPSSHQSLADRWLSARLNVS